MITSGFAGIVLSAEYTGCGAFAPAAAFLAPALIGHVDHASLIESTEHGVSLQCRAQGLSPSVSSALQQRLRLLHRSGSLSDTYPERLSLEGRRTENLTAVVRDPVPSGPDLDGSTRSSHHDLDE